MSTALQIIPRTIEEITDLAERLSKSALLPVAMRGKMPDVLVTILAGQEMGLAPMASLRSFHVIDGKPVMSADGMVAVVLGSGKCTYFERVAQTDTSVTYETLRVGAKTPQRCTWTLAMAKSAALTNKDNWRLYPRAMLASRAKAELARDVYSDVLAGCYTMDEIERPEVKPSAEFLNAVAWPQAVAGNPVVEDAEVIDDLDPEAFNLISSAQTIDELTTIAPLLGKLPPQAKSKARELYAARREYLIEQAKNG